MTSNRSEALTALDNAYTVYFEETDALDTNNGILNTEYLLYQKRRLLKQAMVYLTDDLVKHKQGYPKGNISDVKLSADFVILKKDDFEKISNAIEIMKDE